MDEGRKLSQKVVFLGDSGVGKTSLIHRFIDDKFNADYKVTLEFNFFIKDIITPGTQSSLQIWDIAGREQFSRLTETYLDGARGAVLVYDVTQPKTFQSISFWLNQLQKHSRNIPFILVGNKIDLIGVVRVISEEGKNLATKIKAYNFFETSAKSGVKVQEIFEEISKAMKENST